MKNFLLLITFFITNITLAQDDNPIHISEVMPQFKGGEEKRVEFLSKKIKYPKAAKKAKIGGMSYITFVVEKDGSISDVKVLKPNAGCPPCDEEAIRVTKLMPKWIPGEQDGKKVRVQFNMPLKFTPKQ